MLWGVIPLARTTEVAEMAYVRMSDREARAELGRMVDALRRTSDGEMAEVLAALGPSITEEGERGDGDRSAAGLVPVTLADLDPRAKPKLLAYVGVRGKVLVVIVPSSAIEDNLPVLQGDRTKTERNAATELILEAVNVLPRLEFLCTPRLERLFRTPKGQGAILDACRDADVLLVIEGVPRDLADTGQMMTTSVEGMVKGDADAIARKKNIIGGRVGIVAADSKEHSQRDFGYHQCPLGYRPELRTGPDGVTEVERGSILLNEEHAPALRRMWTEFAKGTPVAHIAELDVVKDLPARDRSGRTLRDLTKGNRHNAVYRFFTRTNLELYRDGTWWLERKTGAPLKQVSGFPLVKRGKKRVATVKGSLPVLMVDGLPWGVPDESWNLAEKRLRDSADETPAQRGGKHGEALLASSAPFTMDGDLYRVVKEHSTFQLRRIDGGAGGRWDPSQSVLVAAANCRTFWQSFGRALGEGLVEVAGRLKPLTYGSVRATTPEGIPDSVERLLADAAQHASEADECAENARVARAEGNDLVRQHWERQQNGFLLEAERLTKEAEAAREAWLAAQTKTPGNVLDVAHPLALAAALAKWDGSYDPELQAAVRALNVPPSLTAELTVAGELQVTCRVELASLDGGSLLLDITFRVANTSNQRDLGPDADRLVALWASTSLTIPELAEATGYAPRTVRKTVYSWLKRNGVPVLALALTLCPVQATRAAVASHLRPDLVEPPTVDERGNPVSDVTRKFLVAIYLAESPGAFLKGWTPADQSDERRVVMALRHANAACDVSLLAAAAGVGVDWSPSKDRPRPFTLVGGRRRRLLECPHEDCSSTVADHVLYTPETAVAGVLCRTCRRLPIKELADVVLPVEYLALWNRDVHAGRADTVLLSAEEISPVDLELAMRAGRLVRIREAARLVGLSEDAFRDRITRGEQPVHVTAGSSRFFDPHLLKDVSGPRKGPPTVPAGWLSVAQVARRLGVPEYRVREYCQEGLLAFKKVRGRICISPAAMAAVVVPEGDLLSSLSVVQLAREAGKTRGQVDYAMQRGYIATVYTSQGTPMISRDEANRWLLRINAAAKG